MRPAARSSAEACREPDLAAAAAARRAAGARARRRSSASGSTPRDVAQDDAAPARGRLWLSHLDGPPPRPELISRAAARDGVLPTCASTTIPAPATATRCGCCLPSSAWRTSACPVDIFAGETLTREFAAFNPARTTPVLETDDGRFLPESAAILTYLAAGTPLLPDDAFERAEVVRWLVYEQTDVIPAIAGLRFRLLTGRLAPDDPDAAAAPRRRRGAAAAGRAPRPAARSSSATATRSPTSRSTATRTGPTRRGSTSRRTPPSAAWLERVEAQPGYIEDVAPYGAERRAPAPAGRSTTTERPPRRARSRRRRRATRACRRPSRAAGTSSRSRAPRPARPAACTAAPAGSGRRSSRAISTASSSRSITPRMMRLPGSVCEDRRVDARLRRSRSRSGRTSRRRARAGTSRPTGRSWMIAA